jgi:hypothetical protein
MRHIKQIQIVRENEIETYTIVIANEPLEEHNSIIQHPDLFKIVDGEIPENAQYLNYE